MSGSVLSLGPVLFSLLKQFIELVHINNDKATGVVGLLEVARATDEELNKQRQRGNKYTTWNNKIH